MKTAMPEANRIRLQRGANVPHLRLPQKKSRNASLKARSLPITAMQQMSRAHQQKIGALL